ncbi:hypothetical protein [Yersinia pseudotuberculosis]|uniref:hypothetical protein n=1 Tax=Yersinia pseudotuberculosis TaxID=633 RepID=UPI0005DB2B9C|nr:hypothetical protein [Yersinia pseudotuberculosis]CNL98579.1 Uncharacterised protein [Yersinia pseudotuberculosis]
MQMLSKEPVRIRHNWDSAVVAECDFCSHTKMTVPRADSGRICASCCDSEFLSSWQGYAKSLETEILSLREQLAGLKALEPLGYIDPRTLTDDGCSGGTWMKKQLREVGPYTMRIFIATKPVEESANAE